MKKLPIGQAFSHALKSTLSNLPFAFHVSWPWIAIMLPLQAITAFYIVSNFPNIDPKSTKPEVVWQLLAANLPATLMSLLSSSSIAVSWHRYIFLDEVPQGWQRLRLDGTVLRYFGNIILLSLIIAAISFVPAIVITLLSAVVPPAIVLFLPLVLICIAYSVRYSVKMPAIALGRRDFGFNDALQATRGSTWQVLGFLLLVFAVALGLALAAALITYPFSQMANDFGFLVVLAIQFAVNWVTTIFSVTMLTSLYGFFVEDRNF